MYRRTMEELPARSEEVHHAVEEGVKFQLLTAPLEIIGNEAGWAVGVKCQKMQLGEPDAFRQKATGADRGRLLRYRVRHGHRGHRQCSQSAGSDTTKNLETNKWGNIVADLETGKTSKDRVWAGGDIVTGAATVILAMGAGRKAALSMLSTFG